MDALSLEGPWPPLETGPRVRVVLLTFKGETRHSWEASLVQSDEEMVIMRAVARRGLQFEEVVIRPGDLVLQYFPRSEWFSIQEYRTTSGELKGWYCNIATPPQPQGSTITTQDLIVGIVSPDGQYKVLDMDELEERKRLLQEMVENIHRARKKLIQMIEKREFPFHLRC